MVKAARELNKIVLLWLHTGTKREMVKTRDDYSKTADDFTERLIGITIPSRNRNTKIPICNQFSERNRIGPNEANHR